MSQGTKISVTRTRCLFLMWKWNIILYGFKCLKPKKCLIGNILEPISANFEPILEHKLIVSFSESYRFHIKHMAMPISLPVSFLSNVDKLIILYRSKRYGPFINFRRSLDIILLPTVKKPKQKSLPSEIGGRDKSRLCRWSQGSMPRTSDQSPPSYDSSCTIDVHD